MVVAIAGGVLAFWVFFIWRVRAEQGWVGVSDRARIRLVASMARLVLTIGEAFLGPVKKATVEIVKWHEALAKMVTPAQKASEAMSAFERDS